MRGNALAAMEHFDRAGGEARPQHLAQEPVRHRVVMLLDLDVIVEAGTAFLPFAERVGLGRQRLQGGSLELLKQRPSARAEMARHAVIESGDLDGDRRIQGSQREEAVVPELGDDPARRHLYGDFDLGLVARLVGSGRHHGCVIVGRHLAVGAVHRRLVEAGFGNPGLQVVRDDHRRYAAEKPEGARVRTDPVGKPLAPGGLGKGVTGGAERGDEQLRGKHLAARPVDHFQRRAGVIDEQPLAGDMALPHRRRQATFPRPIQLTEAAIAVAARIRGAVLLPDQL